MPGLKRFARLMAAVWLSLAVMGCATAVDYQMPEAVTLPDDADRYLADAERALGNVRPGAEKRIVWFDPARKNKTPYALVYLHGFSASRKEIAPVCDNLAQNLKANLFYTRLNGHGQDIEAMGKATLNDWLADGAESVALGEKIGDKIILVGMSTGGTLSAWLANQPYLNKRIHAVVLLSPNFHPKNRLTRVALWPGGKALTKMLVGEYREWQPRNQAVAEIYTTRYRSNALVTMMQMIRLLEKEDLSTLKVPFLVIYNENDQVIHPGRIKTRFAQIGSMRKKLVPFPQTQDPWGHVLAGDAQSPQSNAAVTNLILDFLNGL